MKDKVAIVGGFGFLGSRLSSRLNKNNINHTIYDISINEDTEHMKFLDVEDSNSLNKLANSDLIINLAAVHRDDIQPISRYDDVNVKGAENICNAARKFDIKKIIFTSSVAIYGFAPANTMEDGSPNYFNDYGRTKYLAEKVYKEWQSEDPSNRTLIIIRPTVIFGEGNRGNVYNLLNQIAKNRFLMIGDGTNVKSMAYVENVAAFIEHFIGYDEGLHIYNYIDKPDFNMNSLVTLTKKTLFNKEKVGLRLPIFMGIAAGMYADFFSKITKKNLPISSIRIKKFIGTTQFNTSLDKTNFIPPVSIEEGLIKTLKYEFLEDNSNLKTYETE